MEIKLDKRDVERVLNNIVNDQRTRRKILENGSVNNLQDCIKRQEQMIRYEIYETLIYQLGLTDEIIISKDKYNNISIK